ncbi:hypothetical protein CVT24_004881 [Panaeolus cyanescens]|uniref:Uncharacterized protein n=1 Tax=Panaeolus cyanescens TaxID=181874 RepID=A0A409V9W6_9AGAR|nr:hypothetical protein CVT24_004881 [Panaeolus cyanescens]
MDVNVEHGSTLLSLFIGAFISTMLFGIHISQAVRYFHHYTGQNKWMDALALFILSLEVGHLAVMFCLMYQSLIVNFNNSPLSLFQALRYQRYCGFVSAIITYVTQLYFAWRYFKLSRNTIACLVATVCSTLKTVGYYVTNLHCIRYPDFASNVSRWLMLAGGILSVTSHLVVAGGLYMLLYEREREATKLLGPRHHLVSPIDGVILRCIQADLIPGSPILVSPVPNCLSVIYAFVLHFSPVPPSEFSPTTESDCSQMEKSTLSSVV